MDKRNISISIIMCIVLLSQLLVFEKNTEYYDAFEGEAAISANYDMDDIEYFRSNEHELSIRDVLRNNSTRIVWFLFACLLFMAAANCGNFHICKRFCWITPICCIRKRYLIYYIHKKDGEK